MTDYCCESAAAASRYLGALREKDGRLLTLEEKLRRAEERIEDLERELERLLSIEEAKR